MRKKCGRLLACLLIGAMLLLQGCKGREDGSGGQTGGGDGNSPAPAASAESESNGEKSMGRYLEEEITLPEDMTYGSSYPTLCLQKLETGELALLEQTAGMYVSADNGESWTWTTHDPLELIEDFNRQRDYAFYEDGTAYINYNGLDLLLDLSLLWESDYWGGAAPEICELSQYQINYTYEDGELWLTLAGELLHDGSPFLRGYAFECTWYVSYYSGSLTGYRGTLTAGRINELRSDFAVEPEPPELTDAWREVLAEIWGKCEKNGENVFAVHDVNGDGEDELIVRWTLEGSPNYGWGTTVYDANGKAQFYGGGRLTFYSNGAISVPWSHNQGPAMAIWPYDLYTCHVTFYNGINHSHYTEAGSARARCNNVPNFEDVAYADLDGDGVVYFIGEDAYREENPVDNDVYEAWRNQYLAGAQVLPVWYYPLTEENISLIG